MIDRYLFLYFALLCFGTVIVEVSALNEDDRLLEYAARNYTWPPKYSPATEGWKKLMNERFAQIEEMEGEGEKYEAYMQTLPSSFMLPNFTEYGFGLARAPEGLTKEIQQAIHDAIARGRTRRERRIQVIDGPQAEFVDRRDLVERVMHELQPYVEAWTGIKVIPNNAYGFRLYQNQSALYMHTDKIETHIVSTIYHIDSSDDAEPWPIFIEGLDGKTYEVILTPGDILFYESSKCFHGRPRRFNGSWYTSVFVHYYPIDWQTVDHFMETHYAVPPHWHETVAQKQHARLEMSGTGMKEPNCPDSWCRAQNSVKWSGPGEEGVWISPDLKIHPLNLSPEDEDEEL